MRLVALLPVPMLLLAAPPALSDGDAHDSPSRPDDHAPIGVMGDHVHAAGEIMLSYRYARMRMSGNRTRTEHQSKGDVFDEGFVITPTDMDVQMHVIGAMWAPTDRLTLMGMLPFLDVGMDHENIAGGRFETHSDGVGDVKLTGLFRLWKDEGHDLLFNLGLSLPTGSIDEKDDVLPPPGVPMRVRLPYPMQLGSGSVDVIPGLTYMGRGEGLSWGGQALGTIRTHENENDYRLGDRVDLTAWVARPWTSWVSTSLRTAWGWWGNLRGKDPRLNPAAVPTADPDRRAGWRLDVLAGVNFLVPESGHRLAVEFGLPAAQWLDGPQLETDWRLVVGWQKAFGPFGD